MPRRIAQNNLQLNIERNLHNEGLEVIETRTDRQTDDEQISWAPLVLAQLKEC